TCSLRHSSPPDRTHLRIRSAAPKFGDSDTSRYDIRDAANQLFSLAAGWGVTGGNLGKMPALRADHSRRSHAMRLRHCSPSILATFTRDCPAALVSYAGSRLPDYRVC